MIASRHSWRLGSKWTPQARLWPTHWATRKFLHEDTTSDVTSEVVQERITNILKEMDDVACGGEFVMREYENRYGTPIEFELLGHKRLKSLLETMPLIQLTKNSHGTMFVQLLNEATRPTDVNDLTRPMDMNDLKTVQRRLAGLLRSPQVISGLRRMYEQAYGVKMDLEGLGFERFSYLVATIPGVQFNKNEKGHSVVSLHKETDSMQESDDMDEEGNTIVSIRKSYADAGQSEETAVHKNPNEVRPSPNSREEAFHSLLTSISTADSDYPGHVLGTCDASKAGLGGVFFLLEDHDRPFVWRHKLGAKLSKLIIGTSHLGTISVNELELAATVIQDYAIASCTDVAEKTIRTFTDSTYAVGWRNKAPTAAAGPSAYLLREAILTQRRLCQVTRVHYISSDANLMSDIASRRFDLTDDELLQTLTSFAPQEYPWQMLQIPDEVTLSITNALLKQKHEKLSAAITGPSELAELVPKPEEP